MMRKRTFRSLIPVVAVAVASAATPAAQAKEISAIKVCGSSGCVDLHRGDMLALADPGPPLYGYHSARDVPGKSPLYRVTMTVGGGGAHERFRVDFLPGAGLVRGADGTWIRLDTQARRALAEATRGLRPLRASRLDLAGPNADGSSSAAGSSAAGSSAARPSPGVGPAASDEPETAGSGPGLWPWLALGPVLLLVAGVGWARRGRSDRGDRGAGGA